MHNVRIRYNSCISECYNVSFLHFRLIQDDIVATKFISTTEFVTSLPNFGYSYSETFLKIGSIL